MTIRVLTFDELEPRTAYALWRLRQQVFIIEQGSPYPDLDGRDLEPTTRHFLLEVDGCPEAGEVLRDVAAHAPRRHPGRSGVARAGHQRRRAARLEIHVRAADHHDVRRRAGHLGDSTARSSG